MLRERKQAPFGDYQRFCEEAVKFYPYQRREAAALLRNKGNQDLSSTQRQNAGSNSGSSAGTAGEKAQGSAAETLKKAMPEIEKHLSGEDFDSALTVLDKLAKDCKDYAPFHLLRGKTNWQLANQGRDNGRKGVEFFYQDAVRAFQRAV